MTHFAIPNNRIFLIVVIAFSLFCFSNTAPDPDLWGHIRFGLDITRDRALPSIDAYSYTASGPAYRGGSAERQRRSRI